MLDNYGFDANTLPPELMLEARALMRRQKLAEAMMQQSQQPLEAPVVKGRFTVPISPVAGLGKLAQAYFAGQQMNDADKGMAGLGGRQRQGIAEAIANYQTTKAGTPDKSAPFDMASVGQDMPEERAIEGLQAVTPGVKGDPRKAIMDAMMNPYLAKNPFIAAEAKTLQPTTLGRSMVIPATGETVATDSTWQAEQEAARQARQETIAMQLREGRITREEADKRSADLRRELAAQADARARDLAADKIQSQKELRTLAGAIRQPPAPIVQTDDAGNTKMYDRSGNLIKDLGGVGKPSATYAKTQAAKKQLGIDLDRAITELDRATKDGGLIDKSTGSGAGALVDVGAGFFGQATPGAVAVGQMKPIYDLVLKMVPRFEGPQSDKDTKTYQDASGQLANPAVPNTQKKAAGKEILRLMRERKSQFVNKEIAETDVPQRRATDGNDEPPPGAVRPR